MKVTARLKNLRMSPQKVRVVARTVKGDGVDNALARLNHDMRVAALPLKKLIESAVANAKENHKVDKDALSVYDVQVGEGPTLKRYRPRAYGRATKIMKRTSRIIVTLESEDKKPAAKKAAKKVATKKTAKKAPAKKAATKKATTKKVAKKATPKKK